MRYVISAPAKRLFSFPIGEKGLKNFSRAAERYVQAHAERSFPTLDYFKQFANSEFGMRKSEL